MTANVTKVGLIGNSSFSVGRFTYGFNNISVIQYGEGASLKIGAFCSISASVKIFLGGNHRTDWITTFPFGHIYQNELGGADIKGHPATKGDVIIGDDVWIGQGVTIMSGITIGSGAVIAANATVVKNVLPYHIVGGNPAKILKKRFENEIVELLLKLKWWDLPIEIIGQINKILSSPPEKKLLTDLLENFKAHYPHPDHPGGADEEDQEGGPSSESQVHP